MKVNREDELETEKDAENASARVQETPQEFRTRLRAGEGKLAPTTGLCPGYQQANMAFIPDEHFEEFAQFCELNPGPMPVLHKSGEVGDFNADPTIFVKSTNRFEYPHSLSYHPHIFTRFP